MCCGREGFVCTVCVSAQEFIPHFEGATRDTEMRDDGERQRGIYARGI